MTKPSRGGKYHPSRVSGYQKFLRAKQANKEIEKKNIKKSLKIIDIKKQDWSIK